MPHIAKIAEIAEIVEIIEITAITAMLQRLQRCHKIAEHIDIANLRSKTVQILENTPRTRSETASLPEEFPHDTFQQIH